MEFNSDTNTIDEIDEIYSQVYQPEADTYLLYKSALREMKSNDRVLEVGTGSGYISKNLTTAAAEIQNASVTALDINPYACKSAKRSGVEVFRSNLFSAIKPDLSESEKFSLVLFNPPYLPTAPEERIDDWLEYALDGGESGRDVIEKFADGLSGVLSRYGRCLLLISSLTGLDEVSSYFAKKGFISLVLDEEKTEDEILYVIRIMHDICCMAV